MKQLPDGHGVNALDKVCAHCGEYLYTIVRAHHHTENGIDVSGA